MVERQGKQEVQSERKIYKRMYGGQQQFFYVNFWWFVLIGSLT
jgi:hypothetical protein